MRIAVVAVGRCRTPFLRQGIEDYASRIAHYASLNEIEVADERVVKGTVVSKAVEKEGQRLLQAVPKGAYTVALDAAGGPLSSEGLAERISTLGMSGRSRMAFLVGGPFGLAPEVLENTDRQLSLSSMTLPHELARLVLMEQIYRAFTIIRGESYHK